MGSEIQIFSFDSYEVRTVIGGDGEPWWIAADVCRVLGIAQPASSLRSLDDDERGVHTMHTPGGLQEMTTINEPGLYSLILTSRKPEAKRFKRWITHEVIPAIRKTGQYKVESPPLSGHDLLLAQAKMMVEVVERQITQECRLGAVECELSVIRAVADTAFDKAAAALVATSEDTGYVTVLGYCRLRSFNLGSDELKDHGQGIASYCRLAGIQIKKVPSEKWGKVNAYPIHVLNDWFSERGAA
jgi:prophage antirepressor-like protein